MEATFSRGGRTRQTPVVLIALVAGLTLGGFGGYSINGFMRPSPITASGVPLRTDATGNGLALSMARHATTERNEALDATDLATSMARHANSERAEAGAINGLRQ